MRETSWHTMREGDRDEGETGQEMRWLKEKKMKYEAA